MRIESETCVIYCRVSQDRYNEGAGVKRQEEDCRILAERLGLRVTNVYIDNDVSAFSGKARPEFEAMLEIRPEIILAWHQDRLLRRTKDLERIIDLEIPAHFVQSGSLDLANPAGRATARTVAAWSQYESEQKGLRRQAANAQRAQQGAWQFSRRPYGYKRIDGTIVQVPAEADAIREAYRRYIAGDSYKMIADDFNSRGLTTTNGAAWLPVHIRGTLMNPRYAGIVKYLGKSVPEAEPQWDPIITRDLWDRYRQVCKGRKKAGSPSAGKPVHLMSGFAVCGICGEGLYAHKVLRRKRKDGTRAEPYRAYDCMHKRCVSIQADKFDDLAEQIILERLKDPQLIAALRSAPDTAALDKELKELHRRRDDIGELVGEGLLSRTKARSQLLELASKIDRLETRISAVRSESPLAELALGEDVTKRWETLSLIEKRSIIEVLGMRIAVKRGKRGHVYRGKPINTERLEVEWV